MSYLARALSIRLIFFCLLVGVGVGVVLQVMWSAVPLMFVVWSVSAATYVLAVWGGGEGGQMVKCPACRKRVKMGADTCHHCGYSNAVR